MRIVMLFLAAYGIVCAQSSRPRIAIAGMAHESNSFSPTPTALKDFMIRRGDEIVREWAESNHEVAGYIAGAKLYDFEIYPALMAQAVPAGPVTNDALDKITAEIIDRLEKAPKLDGLLLALHGAMVTETYPHGDPEVMKRLRSALGKDFPIVVTHDFHANIAPDMWKLSTALVTYKEVPHIDQKNRGLKAAEIMSGIARGRVKPTQAGVKPPMIYNIRYHHTSSEPLLPIVAETKRLEKQPKILAASVSGGYQYADVEWVGPTAVVVTDNDPGLAQREAQRLSDMLWATRDKLTKQLPEAPEAVAAAIAELKFPVILVEMGDNIGGGSAGDSTFMLAELLKQKAKGWVEAVADPAAAMIASRAGVGAAFNELVGGKIDSLHGSPVRVKGVVRSLHSGKYIETEPRHGGARYHDQGLTAVIEVEGSTLDLPTLLMLTTKRQVPFSLHQLISCGIYPEKQKILVVKAAIAFRAAYEPIAARIIEVDTGGLTAVNPSRFTFVRARKGLFGLDK